MSMNSYPIYRRRSVENGGRSYILRNGIVMDNRWVVPYNPTLLQMFNCHINVEYCHSIKAIKYLCKYITKGEDLSTVGIVLNEIERYIHGRYISASEAMWRIFKFHIHERYPSVRL